MIETITVSTCDVCLTDKKRKSKPNTGETTSVTLDGITYELEICEPHKTALREASAPYVDNGRKIPGSRVNGSQPVKPVKPRGRTTETRIQSKVVRQWAREHNIPVGANGRIPVAVMARFNAEAGQPVG